FRPRYALGHIKALHEGTGNQQIPCAYSLPFNRCRKTPSAATFFGAAGERLMLAPHPVSPSRWMPASQGTGCYGSHLPGFVLRLSPAAATPSVPPLVPAGRGRRFAQSRLSL